MNENPFRADNLHYNQQQDTLYCHIGQPMQRTGDRKTENRSGYPQTYARYEARNCEGCPLRTQCFKGKDNRILELNHKLRAHKQKVRKNLYSQMGIAHR